MKNRYRQNVLGAVVCFIASFMISSVSVLAIQWITEHISDRLMATIILLIIALFLGIMGLVYARDAGEESNIGTLADEQNLIDNNIYQVVGRGAYIKENLHFLRLQNDEIKGFQLAGNVPDVFKWTRKIDKPDEHEYKPYPRHVSI